MAEVSDAYQTIQGDASAQFVEQRSRFLSFAYHVTDLEAVKAKMDALQKEYYDARHICYAYMLGPERLEYRANDNGEPSGTAGKPILGQINSAGLTDVLIAVVRYFGGVKLGTSGLIEAYRLGAQMAIQESEIVTRFVQQDLKVFYNFDLMNEVMKIVKDIADIKFGYNSTTFDDEGEKIQNIGKEFGVTTGRPRRCGWFDAVIMKYAVLVGGLTSIALTKIDVFDTFDEIKVCTAYKDTRDGTIYTSYPTDVFIHKYFLNNKFIFK